MSATGRVREETNGSETHYCDLNLIFGDQIIKGGTVAGSTFESSPTYDRTFERTGDGSIRWAFSRSLGSLTVSIKK